MNNWINVKDRQPTMTARYWVAVGTAQMEAIYYRHLEHWRALNGDYLQPTHWQPLPEPPVDTTDFETWWAQQETDPRYPEDFACVGIAPGECITYKEEARAIWDAAVASTKSSQ